MMKRKLVAALGAVFMTGAVLGAGFQLYTEGSAEALGQGGAISGRADLTSLAWYNPAALAGAEAPSIMAGATLVTIRTDFTSPAGDARMSDDVRAVPHFYYVQPLGETLTGTLSVNAPYGLITEWDAGWAGESIALSSDLEAVYVTPCIAWRPLDQLSIAAGVNVVSGKAELTRAPAPGVEAKVTGDDMAYGATLSARYQPFEDWAIGARYQSSVKLDITGTLTAAGSMLPASAELELPPTVNIGVANTSIKNLKLGVDLVWTGWSTYDQLSIVAPPSPPATSPKLWDDVVSVRLGGEYALGEDWKLRGGYVWDQSPVPDQTRSPELPGSDRQMVTLGFGWKCWEGMSLDAAYSFLWADPSGMGAIYPLPGEFEASTHLLALSVGYDF